MAKSYAHPEVLVSTAWVDEHRHDPKVRIVESDEDVLLYQQGHVPGAVKIDWHNDLQDQIVRDYIDKGRFAELCSSKGIAPRHDRRLLRRQEQLVGLLRHVGVQALRPRRLPHHGRRPQALGARRPALVARRRDQLSRGPTTWPTIPIRRSARFATKSSNTSAPASSWSTSAHPASTRASCCTWPTTRRRGRCAAGTFPAPATSPGRAPPTTTARSRVAKDLEKIYAGEGGLEAARAGGRILPYR